MHHYQGSSRVASLATTRRSGLWCAGLSHLKADVFMSDSQQPSKPTDLESTLLTNDQKWWEFLDPATNTVQQMPSANRQSSDLLDWSSVRKTQRHAAVGMGVFHRCESCGSPCPPDMTFCAHCGGRPKGTGLPQIYSLVIKEFKDQASLMAAAEMITEAGDGLRLNEVVGMLKQQPAVFNFTTYRERATALVQRLAEHGVYSKTFAIDDPGIPWLSETIESIVRDFKELAIFGGVILATVAVAAFVGWFGIIAGVVGIGVLFHRRMNWYREHYHINSQILLDRMVGFEEGRAEVAQTVLHRMRDTELRNILSVCLMEYYALHKMFRDHEAVWSEVLMPSDHALKELIDQILASAQKYEELSRTLNLVEPAEVRERLVRLRQQMEQADSTTQRLLADEERHLQKTLDQATRLPEIRTHFGDRLRAMSSSLEAMRQRLTTMFASNQMIDEIPMEAIIRELDEELEIFEETFEAMR